MKKFRSLLAAIGITWAILFSCRVVMVATPLNVVEQIALVLSLVEYTMFKAKQIEVNDETSKKGNGQNDK